MKVLIQDKRIRKRKYLFNFFDSLFLIFCKYFANNKMKTLNYYYEKLCAYAFEYTDVMNIAKNLNEIEKIKFVMFDKYQLAMFNKNAKIENPLLRDSKNKMSELYKTMKIPEIVNEYLTSFMKAAEKNNLSNLDKKLLDLC
jgi:hypothetical protein